MSLLGVDELLKYAIRIEESGEAFYREWAGKVQTEDQKSFFVHLANEEIKHKKIFENLKKTAGKVEPDPRTYDEYGAYLQTFAEQILFNEKKHKKEMAQVIDMESAIDFAMKQELDSLLFYNDLLAFVPEEQEEQIEMIKAEERKHYVDLARYKASLKG